MSIFTDKFVRISAIVFILLACNVSTGCVFNPKNKVNLGGVMTYEPSSYTPVETGTIQLRSDEVFNRRDHKGGKTTFLWGLFTYTDY